MSERQCRYPCDCGQFPEEHCSCMEGHTVPEPADQTRADAIPTDPEGDRARHDAWLADQTRADVVLTDHDRFTLSDLFEANRFDRLCEHVERILAARDAEHAAEVEDCEVEVLALKESRRRERDRADAADLRAEAAEATVARVEELWASLNDGDVEQRLRAALAGDR